MPSSRFRIRLLLALAALFGAGVVHGAQAPTAPGAAGAKAPPRAKATAPAKTAISTQGTYTFDAASSEVDYKTHSGSFTHITISQGKITVLADRARASGLGRPSGKWTLEGNVRVHAPPHGSLTSDRAVVDVSGSRITRVTVTGNPAEFTQVGMAPGRTAEGHADEILYDIATSTVQLRTNAWLSDGHNQISGPLVSYNILKDRIEATSSGSGERVHITIAPRKARGQPAKRPAAGAAAPQPPGRSP